MLIFVLGLSLLLYRFVFWYILTWQHYIYNICNVHRRPPIKGPYKSKKAPHMEKKGAERLSHGEKGPQISRKRSKKAPTWRKGEQKGPHMVKMAPIRGKRTKKEASTIEKKYLKGYRYSKNKIVSFSMRGGGVNTYSRPPSPSLRAPMVMCVLLKYVVFLPLYYYGPRVCH